MSDKIHLKVMTHENIVFEDDIDSFSVKTLDGSLGVLPNHLPFVSSLNIGVTKFTKEKTDRFIAVLGGIIQFSSNCATILAPSAELDSSIDVTRAKEANKRALARINAKDDNIDIARAQMALARSIARIQATNKHF